MFTYITLTMFSACAEIDQHFLAHAASLTNIRELRPQIILNVVIASAERDLQDLKKSNSEKWIGLC